jgi:hypothetical protein
MISARSSWAGTYQRRNFGTAPSSSEVYSTSYTSTVLGNSKKAGRTHHGSAGDVGASDGSLDSQEAPRKLHDNNGVLGFFRNAIAGPEIGTMVALETPHAVQKLFLVVWRGKV